MTTKDAILLDQADHVATVLHRIQPGETVSITAPRGQLQLVAAEMIPIFHKIAIKSLPAGTDVLKYGESIGVLTADIDKGGLVHVHNLRSKRARLRSKRTTNEKKRWPAPTR